MVFKKISLVFLVFSFSTSLSGCNLWPYKRDFDCPVGQGVKCKSLYEISKMADRGEFGPDAVKKSNNEDKRTNSKSDKNRDIKICSPNKNCVR